MLIVIEGLDGSGKGVQIELLKKKLPKTIIFKYPTHKTPELNAFLEGKLEIDQRELFHLFLKDIMKEQAEVKKALGSRKLVILDRYVFSTIAYEKDGISYEDGKKIVRDMDFLKPDLVILLDITADIAQERKKKQKSLDRYEENVDYLKKVRENFLQLYKERFLTPNWHKIDASKAISEIHEEILMLLR